MGMDFRLLGDVEVRVGGRLVDVGHARQRCVLAALLVDANHAVPIDELVDRVWAGHVPYRARETLYSYLSRLRRALMSDVRITREPAGYMVAVDPMTVDLHRFRHLTSQARTAPEDRVRVAWLEQALGLWRGPALAGVDTAWASSVRDVMDRERVATELDWADVALRLGRHSELLAGLITALAVRPLDERLAGQLVLALYRCGRQAEALEVCRTVRRTLAQELGIDPGPPLRRLEAAILAHDSALALSGEQPSAAQVSSESRRPDPWNVPMRNPHFTGRTILLGELHHRFQGDAGGPIVQTIYGMGGVGKTQLAIEYAHCYAADTDVIWWIDAEHPVLVPDQFIPLAGRLGLPTAGSVADVVRQVLTELSRLPRCLLIFDNAESPQDIIGYLPSASVRVLVTSRHPAWGGLGGRLEIDVMTRTETVDLLRSRNPDMGVEVANDLAAELGDLPLAAAQAAGYLEQTGLDPAGYLDRFRRRRVELLGRGDVLGYQGRVDTTWVISLDRLIAVDPVAVTVMQCAAYLAPEPIPINLFTNHPDLLDTELAKTVNTDSNAITDAVGAAVSFSLLRRHPDGFQMHRLVQQVVRHRMPATRRMVIEGRVLRLLGAAYPGDPYDPEKEGAYAGLAPHIVAIGSLADNDPATRRMLLATCDYLSLRGHLPAIRILTEEVLNRWQRVLGPDHPDTLNAAAGLTWILSMIPDAHGAVKLGLPSRRRALKALGPHHPVTLRLAVNSVFALIWSGDTEQALQLAHDGVNGYQAIYGPDHPDTLCAEVTLISALNCLTEYEQASSVGAFTLRRATSVLGPDHSLTLRAAINVAGALNGIGQHTQALPLAQNVSHRCQRVLGPDHRLTLEAAEALSRARTAMSARVLSRIEP